MLKCRLEHWALNLSGSMLGPYQLCKYSDMLFQYERSHDLQLWGLLSHAYDWWINNTSYHGGGPDSQHFTYATSFHDHAAPKNIPIHPPPLLLTLSSPFPILNSSFRISFVSIETGSCPMHSSLAAVSFPAGSTSARVPLFANERQPPHPAATNA